MADESTMVNHKLHPMGPTQLEATSPFNGTRQADIPAATNKAALPHELRSPNLPQSVSTGSTAAPHHELRSPNLPQSVSTGSTAAPHHELRSPNLPQSVSTGSTDPLLIYRWLSLLPLLWLYPQTASPAILLSTLGYTSLITLLHRRWLRKLPKRPWLIGGDLLFCAGLLSLSGAATSPYTLYALSPLLIAGLFFRWPAHLLTVGGFSVLYGLLLTQQPLGLAALSTSNGLLLAQLLGFWLIAGLVGQVGSQWQLLQTEHGRLLEAHETLAEQHHDLLATHHQLELTHELSLCLHASNAKAIQQRLLGAVIKDLRFSEAAVALVNPSLCRVEQWCYQAQSASTEDDSLNRAGRASQQPLPPISLKTDRGLLAEAILQQQTRWGAGSQTLTTDETLKHRLGQANWLILPLVHDQQTVAVLLTAVETRGPADPTDERWAILTALVSQAALAFNIVNRSRRLAIEQEQNRIARDIHDTVAQSLFGIVFTLDACSKMLPQQVEAVQQELVELRHMAHRTRQQLRQSILDIWPSELTCDKFKHDLQKYVNHSSPDHVFTVDFTVDGDFDGLPAGIRRTLYRVCQEALTNAARHSGVNSGRVYLYIEPTELSLSIRDKGRGFDTTLVMAREHNREQFGLRSMGERVTALGGSCDILSQLGQGTQILVQLPLNKNLE